LPLDLYKKLDGSIGESVHYNILKNSSYIVLAYGTEMSRVLGFINALSDEISFAFILMLEVLPEYQRLGIGTNLMKGCWNY
jgi:ribosomal protein S18 acetylase RimI-like enzyme